MAEFSMDTVLQQIVGKAAGDNDLLDQLKNEPAKALENMTGIDLPDEQIDAVVKKMGGIEGLVKAYQEGGAEGVLKGAANAEAGDIVGDLLGGESKETENTSGKSSKKKSESDSGENIAGEILGDLLGGK